MTSEVVATFEDRFGDERIVHRTRSGLSLRRQGTTPALAMNRAAADGMGSLIKALREKRGWTLEELAVRAGLRTQSPKQRMWEIENSVRAEGVRLGTLYSIAVALDVEVGALLPSVSDVKDAAGVTTRTLPEVAV